MVPPQLLKTALPTLKGLLVGRDPWDIEAVRHESRGGPAGSTIDICLRDILAEKVGIPLYKLLAAYRDKILAYASIVTK